MQELKDQCLKWSQSVGDAEIQVFDVCEIVLQILLVDFIVYFLKLSCLLRLREFPIGTQGTENLTKRIF